MKRSEFLRKLILGTIAIAATPAILTQGIPGEKDIFEVLKNQIACKRPPNTERLNVYFKITTEALNDPEGFEWYYRVGRKRAKRFGISEDTVPNKIQIGFDEDDFATNLQTVCLTYYKPLTQ